MSTTTPKLYETWYWKNYDDDCEIILLTKFINLQFYGIILFTTDAYQLDTVGTEVWVDDINYIRKEHGWAHLA